MMGFDERQHQLAQLRVPNSVDAGVFEYVLPITGTSPTIGDFTFDEFKDAVDDIFSHSAADAYFTFGGESLLKIDLVKQLYAYIESRYASRTTTYVLPTNGQLLTAEISQFLTESRITPRLYVDCGEFASITPAVAALISVGTLRRGSILVHASSVNAVSEYVKYLHECGLKTLKAGVVVEELDDTFEMAFRSEMSKVSDYALAHTDLVVKNFELDKQAGPMLMVRGVPVYHPQPSQARAIKMHEDIYMSHKQRLN